MKTPFARRIGMNIRSLRTLRDWRQEELAERLAVDPSTVQRWESGCVVPCGFSVLQLATAFGVNADAIYLDLPRDLAEQRALNPRKGSESSVVS